MEYNELKGYTAEPPEDLFEKVERKVARRKAARTVASIVAVAVAASAVLWIALPGSSSADNTDRQVAEARPDVALPTPAVPQNVAEPARQSSPTPQTTIPAATLPTTEEVTKAESTPAEVAPMVEPIHVQTEQHTTPQQSLPSAIGEPAPINVAEAILASDIKQGEAEQEQLSDKVPSKSTHDNGYNNLLWAPNIILPASGDIENGQFKVKASGTVSNFSIVVFNRGGRQVFSSKDIDHPWDATCNGSDVPQGTYVWVATFRDSEGNARREQGSVTVVR